MQEDQSGSEGQRPEYVGPWSPSGREADTSAETGGERSPSPDAGAGPAGRDRPARSCPPAPVPQASRGTTPGQKGTGRPVQYGPSGDYGPGGYSQPGGYPQYPGFEQAGSYGQSGGSGQPGASAISPVATASPVALASPVATASPAALASPVVTASPVATGQGGYGQYGGYGVRRVRPALGLHPAGPSAATGAGPAACWSTSWWRSWPPGSGRRPSPPCTVPRPVTEREHRSQPELRQRLRPGQRLRTGQLGRQRDQHQQRHRCSRWPPRSSPVSWTSPAACSTTAAPPRRPA